MNISEAFEAYRVDCIAFRNQSRKTEEHHEVAKKSLLNYVGDIPLCNLTFEHIRQWKQSMEVRHLATDTIRGYLIRTRMVLKYAKEKGHACLDYERILLSRRGQKIPSFISPEEVQRLIDVQDTPGAKHILRIRNKAVIALLFSSGIRVSELCSMNRLHVKNDFFTILGKGEAAAPSFIDKRARGYIDEYLNKRQDNNQALFVSDLNKKRITPGNVQEILKNARRKAGLVERVTPHTLRHSFATDLLRNGCNLRYVQALMHHKDISTTMIYTHVVDEELHGLYERYHTDPAITMDVL
jgi:site-specific recombinase XerD